MHAKLIAPGAKWDLGGAIMGGMGTTLLETTGARLKWARMRQKKTQKGLGHEVGVGGVYISQLESDTYRGSRALTARLAAALGVSIAFLEMETDDPAPPSAQAEPEQAIFFSAEADEAARLIDAMPEARRAEVLALVRVMARFAVESVESVEPMPGGTGARLILGELTQ